MNDRFLRKIILFTFFLSLSCSVKKEIPVREIEVSSVIDLEKLSPPINTNLILLKLSNFHVDHLGNLFFIDQANHRILKYDNQGNFLKQIGSIGQGKQELYNPLGVFIYDDNLYILNNAGKEVKILSGNGDFVSSFKIENAWLSDSIVANGDLIFVGVKYWDKENYNRYKLITIFDKNGNKINEIGKIIKCASQAGYLAFNALFMNIVNKRIFGAYRHRPIIFCYGLDGKEIFYKNLEDQNIEEINLLKRKEEAGGYDTPETKKSDFKIRNIIYCFGFGVDRKMNLYYAINVSPSQGQNRYFILHFNKKGNLVEKMSLKKDGENIQTEMIVIDSRNVRYGIGKLKEKLVLFQF